MIARVIPLTRTPRDRWLYDYIIPDNIVSTFDTGSIVTIPFGKQKSVRAVVYSVVDTSSHTDLKSIIHVERSALVPRDLIDYHIRLADFFCTSPSSFLRRVIPEIPKRTRKHVVETKNDVNFSIKASHLDGIRDAVKKLLDSTSDTYISYQDVEDVLTVITYVFKKEASSLLLCVPYKHMIAEIRVILEALGVTCHDYTASGKNDYLRAWEKTWDEPVVYLGTKDVLFMPIRNVSRVFVLDEAELGYSDQYHRVRLDMRTMLHVFREKRDVTVTWIGNVPSLEAYAQLSSGELTLVALAKHFSAPLVVPMQNQSYEERATGLAGTVKQHIKNTLQSGKKVLLFVNKKGIASQYVCDVCAHPVLCTRCHTPVIRTFEHLECTQCHQRYALDATCSYCGNGNYKEFGHRIGSYHRYVQNQFHDASIVSIHADNADSMIGKLDTADIIVSTRYLLHNMQYTQWKAFGLIVVLNAESFTVSGNYSSQEHGYVSLRILRDKSQSIGALFCVQTYSEDSVLIESLVTGNDAAFYKNELQARRALHYPPYAQKILCEASFRTKEQAQEAANNTYSSILTAKRTARDIKKPYVIFNKGRFAARIVLTYERGERQYPELEALSAQWSIAFNPEHL